VASPPSWPQNCPRPRYPWAVAQCPVCVCVCVCVCVSVRPPACVQDGQPTKTSSTKVSMGCCAMPYGCRSHLSLLICCMSTTDRRAQYMWFQNVSFRRGGRRMPYQLQLWLINPVCAGLRCLAGGLFLIFVGRRKALQDKAMQRQTGG
jgi:hypothetical protein